MIDYLLGRVLRMVVTIFVIVTGVFFATRLSGNAVDFLAGEGLGASERAAMIAYYGLDGSLWEQYVRYLRSLAEGNFGLSFIERRPVATIVLERIGPTLQLLVGATVITLVVSVPAGTLAAVYRRSWIGSSIMVAAFLGYAIPNFILAISLIFVLSFWLGWLPSSGSGSWLHFMMPLMALSAALIASMTRYTRNAMLDILSQDFVRTARAKGLAERIVIFKHALRNALLTVLSVLGLQIAGLATGSVVVETVFAWRGIGELMVNAAIMRDYPVLQFGVLVVAIAVIFINTLIDVAYTIADPRVRIGQG